MKWLRALLASAAMSSSAGAVEEWLDRVEERLSFASADASLRARVSGLLTAEAYRVEQPPPGLVFTSGRTLFNPRLALFLNVQAGDHVLGFVQVRADRGFDPSNDSARVRLDEYAVTFIPWKTRRFNVQVGQFATVVGNWVARHDSWENPFITAPLPYEHQTPIYDSEAPAGVREFVHVDPAEKYEYNPMLWGPVYATGISFSGRVGRFEYALEAKNAGPSSRPEVWSIADLGFGRPAYAARIGYRPDLRWIFGVSASDSVYLVPGVRDLPPGSSRRDFRQRLFGVDARFAWHHLQVWSEVFHSRFQVPRVGTVETVAGYLEAKYKFSPQVFGALRWNRQGFSTVDVGGGRREHWGGALWRVDASAGYRLTSHLEFKLQVSRQHEAGPADAFQTNYAAQFNLRF